MWDINLQFCENFFSLRIRLYNLQFQVYISVFSEKKSELHKKIHYSKIVKKSVRNARLYLHFWKNKSEMQDINLQLLFLRSKLYFFPQNWLFNSQLHFIFQYFEMTNRRGRSVQHSSESPVDQ